MLHFRSLRFLAALVVASLPSYAAAQSPLTAPKLTNHPSWDFVATSPRPLLSIFNAKGGANPRRYEYQLSLSPDFPKEQTLTFDHVKESNPYITEMQIPKGKELKDGRWYWRVRAIDIKGNKGGWATTRFYVDSKHSKTFPNLVRVKPQNVTVSSGKEAASLLDWSDEGQATYWLSLPLGTNAKHWITLDFGKPVTISRFWMLSNPNDLSGRLTDFVWQTSDDNKNWTDLPSTRRQKNDTFRNIVDVKSPVKARYYRLSISGYVGLHARLHAVIPYAKGVPPLPKTPKHPYVLIIGNQLDGFTYTKLQHFIANSTNSGLKTLVVPHHHVSWQMLQKLNPQPIAIVCSGSNAQYQNMPMFEFYGEFELIRKTNIPLLGICAGHQYTCMAYGTTYVRHMGWLNESSLLRRQGMQVPPIHIAEKFRHTAMFQNIPSPFNATEVHSWAVSDVSLPDDYVVTSRSKYIETLQSKSRPVFGAQFHGEVDEPFNQGGPYIKNFLKIALSRSDQTP